LAEHRQENEADKNGETRNVGAPLMKIPMYDQGGQIVGENEIPEDVMAAASRLESWLRQQPMPTSLMGIGIIEQHFPRTITGFARIERS